MERLKYFTVTLIIIILDQFSKFEVRRLIKYGDIIKVTDKFLWLTNISNNGAAFSISFGSGTFNRIFFITFSIITIFIITYLAFKTKSKLEAFAFFMILGGAFGNLIDRIYSGKVTDFIWVDFPDVIMQRWPVFNVADSSIVIALILIVINSLFFSRKMEVK